ncbi:YgfZ/GcvT domain-containing protein [Actinomyces succiniciruminis]|uniref:Glycine cleavage T-protein barrel domain protein n=1 Tax=Actinomyces succiniciruminis TaxID=1522002 RepID=A0A1L7RL58_9ACTO|nr:folate-binding protein YgfZ [Actinomyces succiniciruminis]CED90880.1 Glycine cleavage T-protein barrel domain protein [Actinomyces succiniciruminis]
MRRSPLLDRPDAVANPVGDLDAAVPARYGDPLREQNALLDGRAATALARDVVAVTGPDRLSWLNTLSSQELTRLTPGDGGAETLLLDAQGHITHALACVDDGTALWLVTEAGRGRELAEFLQSMRFMLRVEVAVREDAAVLAALGEGGGALEEASRAAGAYLATWRDPWPGVVEGGTSYDVGLNREHPGAGYRATWVLVQADAAGTVANAFLAGGNAAADVGGAERRNSMPGVPGRSLAGSLAWEALRVEAGRPRWGREVDARTIPHELDWLRTAVHLNKGCYPGQETIARTLNLGRPPRRLTILQLDGFTGQLPVPGANVRLGERVVGTVTSVARHVDYGPMALALLRRGVPADAPLTVDIVAEAEEEETESATGSREEPEAVARVDAAQEPLVSPEGRAQATPAERPGAGLGRREARGQEVNRRQGAGRGLLR